MNPHRYRNLIALCILGTTLALGGCVSKENAYRVLNDQGYTSIHLSDSSDWFSGCSCSRDDFYSTPFTAKTINGYEVNGVVCEGSAWGKAITVRIF